MNTAYWHARHRRLRLIPSSPASRVPKQSFDPTAAFVWLVLVPISGAFGWYGAWRTVVFLSRLVWSAL